MKKVIIFASIFIVLLVGGFFAYKAFFYSDDKKKTEEVVDYSKALENQVVMETITTNLKEEDHFIVVSFSVQPDSFKSKEEFENRLSEMKSLAIQTFNGLEKSTIIEGDGSKVIINALLDTYNKHLTMGTLTNVYLTEFKVQ